MLELDREDLIHDAARRSAEIMSKKADGIRTALRQRPLRDIARRSAATLAPDQSQLEMAFLSAQYTIICPGFEVYYAGTDRQVYPFLQSILLSYLQEADGTPRAHKWITFRELPGGQFYHRAFQGYTGDHMAAHLGNDLEAFKRGASALSEVRLSDYGNAAYSFRVLPNIHVAVVYWLGDEEFAARANLLFDQSASHYLPIDGLAVVGSQLISKIIKDRV